MPNRTIYLPEDLDALSRRFGLNLSKLTQEAILHYVEGDPAAAVDARVAAALERIAEMEIEWPEDYLAASRAEAGER